MDQRSHFKSDLHRLNVKLSHAGKNTVKEEDFDELTSDTFSRDLDVSSISGSEDEEDKASRSSNRVPEGSTQNLKQKLVISLQSGERVSLWKCFILKDSEDILYETEQSAFFSNGAYLRENDVVQKLKELVHEPKVKGLRVVLLSRGGHFAGCVFDGNKVVAHKTFHSAHWMLAVINPHKNMVFWLDPLRLTPPKGVKMLFQRVLKRLQGSNSQEKLKMVWENNKKCALQANNNDCGFYVARYMEEIVSNGITYHDIDECCCIIGSDDGYTQHEIDETRDNWVRYVMDLAINE